MSYSSKTPKSRAFTSRTVSTDNLRVNIPTAKTPSKRTFYDKKYYCLKIKDHMHKISAEIARVEAAKNSNYMNACTLVSDRANAKARAKVFSEHQTELNVLNAVLQMYLSKMSVEDLIGKTENVRDEIQDTIHNLEKSFRYKRRCFDLKASIEDVLKAEEDILDLMKEEDKQKYLNMVSENKDFLRKIIDTEAKIKEIKGSILQYEEFLKGNSKKFKKIHLLKDIYQKQQQLQTMENETNENSMHSIKKDKKDTEALGKMKSRLEEELQSKEKELQEITRIINSGSKSKLKQYIMREEEISNYIEKFDQTIADVRKNIQQKNSQIAAALDYLLGSTGNIDEIATLDTTENAESYDVLNSKLRKLMEFDRKYHCDIEEIQSKYKHLKTELATYDDIDSMCQQNDFKIERLEEQKRVLNATLVTTTSAVRNAKKQLIELQVLLSGSDEHSALLEVYNEMEKLAIENTEMKEVLKDEESAGGEFNDELNEIDQLVNKTNKKIINSLKSRQ